MKNGFACAFLVALAFGSVSTAAGATTARRSVFGVMPDGAQVEAVRLENNNGVSVNVVSYGAMLQSVILPDTQGHLADVTLGYATLPPYLGKPQYFGMTVGRFANRLAKGHYVIDGKAYAAPVNNGVNSLHGGTVGFDKVNWEVVKVTEGAIGAVELRYVSSDGDMGYPGQLTVTARYALDEENRLTITYEATTTKPTIVNITNHTYWNLAGEDSARPVEGQQLQILADAFLPTDETAIPTGEIRPVAGTAFDFRQPKLIGQDVRDGRDQQIVFGHGYDHNWVISLTTAPAPRLVAMVSDPVSGRKIELYSDQPGLQFYSGNFLDGTTVGKSGHIYREGDAFVLEPQKFPDAPNQPKFESPRLNPGQTYRNTIIYKFCSDEICR